jgi:hypothetical protein
LTWKIEGNRDMNHISWLVSMTGLFDRFLPSQERQERYPSQWKTRGRE